MEARVFAHPPGMGVSGKVGGVGKLRPRGLAGLQTSPYLPLQRGKQSGSWPCVEVLQAQELAPGIPPRPMKWEQQEGTEQSHPTPTPAQRPSLSKTSRKFQGENQDSHWGGN